MSEVLVSGRRLPLSRALVARIVRQVLRSERREAVVSVTFLGRDAMRQLNREHKGHDEPTDVLTFALTDPTGGILGDIYICPWVARREARA
ncbi:MAG TPA: rRNA maturation RNase YbeY, partial [Gemmatimonadales bacterium]|nr:rRNA maturation RNase YbeY [Gemmatimonadales bacterium]